MIARLENVSKTYQMGDQLLTALQPTSLEVNEGQLLLIIGPSGSGKTTLLSLLGCVISPSTGNLWLSGQHVNTMNQNQLADVRLHNIGFVFQNFNLLAPLNAEQNVMMPLLLLGLSSNEAALKANTALQLVGMIEKRKSLPKQLSGGQQQRIAIARALVAEPKLILCDEPTASLDKDSISIVMNELKALAEGGKAVAVVTHDPRLKSYAHRIVEVSNGVATEVKDISNQKI